MSPQLLKCMAISLKLQETAQAMRTLFGPKWERKKSEVMPLLEAVMKRDKCELLEAAQKVAKWAADEGNGMFAAIVLATAADCIESEQRKEVAA